MSAKFTVVLGGAASGKSALAEQLAVTSGKSRVYVATSQILDGEMRAKVSRHVRQRGPGWHTIEAPMDLAPHLAGLDAGQVALIDCATMWLTNHLLADSDLAEEQQALLAAIGASAAEIIVVTNEVGHGIVPDNVLSRRFREAQGRLNVDLAARADRVVLVAAGLPLVLKGDMP